MIAMPGVTNAESHTATATDLHGALEQQRAFRTEQLVELAAAATRGSIDGPRDEITDALRAGAASALRDIEAALARMEAGHYGICEVCRRTIPMQRLEILPMAAVCMSCARDQQAVVADASYVRNCSL